MKNSMIRAVLPVFLSAAMLGCSDVTTDVVPTYNMFFTHDTTTTSTRLTYTSGSGDIEITYTDAGGQLAKEQTFSNTSVDAAFPGYAEFLLLPQGWSEYTLGFGCVDCLRFRFKTNAAGSSLNQLLTVATNNDQFWINGDIFDSFNEIGADEVQVQYITGDSGDPTPRYYWSASSGSVTLNRKEVTPTSSETGNAAINVTFNNVAINIGGTDYVVNGSSDIVATDNDVN